MAEKQQQQPIVVEMSEPSEGRRRRPFRPGRMIILALVFLLLGALASAGTVYHGSRTTFYWNEWSPLSRETVLWWDENKPEQFTLIPDTVIVMENSWGTCTFLFADNGQIYEEECVVAHLGYPVRFCQGTVWRALDRPTPTPNLPAPGYVVRYKRSENWLGDPNVTIVGFGLLRVMPGAIPTKLQFVPSLVNWLFWTLALFVPITLVTTIVRAGRATWQTLRLRRGQCPKCSYPMGESSRCTECGEPLRQHIRSHH